MPKQVTVSCVHLTSYDFLQTLPLASNALVIRIIFPWVGATLLSCKQTGLPALLGKQKKPARNEVPPKTCTKLWGFFICTNQHTPAHLKWSWHVSISKMLQHHSCRRSTMYPLDKSHTGLKLLKSMVIKALFHITPRHQNQISLRCSLRCGNKSGLWGIPAHSLIWARQGFYQNGKKIMLDMVLMA